VIEKYLSKSPASENLSGFDTDKFWNIVEEAEHGNQLALNILTELGRDLGTGASNLVNIFNPSLIVLGGALIAPGELLLPEMANTIQSAALKQPRNQVQLSLSDLGNQACALGAVALVLDYVMKQPFVL
jgi:predicted NBD/HSP70 family sugar kinase